MRREDDRGINISKDSKEIVNDNNIRLIGEGREFDISKEINNKFKYKEGVNVNERGPSTIRDQMVRKCTQIITDSYANTEGYQMFLGTYTLGKVIKSPEAEWLDISKVMNDILEVFESTESKGSIAAYITCYETHRLSKNKDKDIKSNKIKSKIKDGIKDKGINSDIKIEINIEDNDKIKKLKELGIGIDSLNAELNYEELTTTELGDTLAEVKENIEESKIKVIKGHEDKGTKHRAGYPHIHFIVITRKDLNKKPKVILDLEKKLFHLGHYDLRISKVRNNMAEWNKTYNYTLKEGFISDTIANIKQYVEPKGSKQIILKIDENLIDIAKKIVDKITCSIGVVINKVIDNRTIKIKTEQDLVLNNIIKIMRLNKLKIQDNFFYACEPGSLVYNIKIPIDEVLAAMARLDNDILDGMLRGKDRLIKQLIEYGSLFNDEFNWISDKVLFEFDDMIWDYTASIELGRIIGYTKQYAIDQGYTCIHKFNCTFHSWEIPYKIITIAFANGYNNLFMFFYTLSKLLNKRKNKSKNALLVSGLPGTGKSSIVFELIRIIWGSKNIGSTELSGSFGLQGLLDSKVIVLNEWTLNNKNLSLQNLYRIIDGEDIAIDIKYGRAAKLNPNIPIILITNETVHDIYQVGPLKRRFDIIELNRQLPDDEDEIFSTILEGDLHGILILFCVSNWIINSFNKNQRRMDLSYNIEIRNEYISGNTSVNAETAYIDNEMENIQKYNWSNVSTEIKNNMNEAFGTDINGFIKYFQLDKIEILKHKSSSMLEPEVIAEYMESKETSGRFSRVTLLGNLLASHYKTKIYLDKENNQERDHIKVLTDQINTFKQTWDKFSYNFLYRKDGFNYGYNYIKSFLYKQETSDGEYKVIIKNEKGNEVVIYIKK